MKFCWIDLEMTGLDVEAHRILEVAMIITDETWTELFCMTEPVYQNESVLMDMNEWSRKHHSESGLLEKVAVARDLKSIETDMLIALDEFYDEGEDIYLAGNSIAQDRKFIDRYLSRLSRSLHYRMLDVSSFKLIFESFYGKKFDKKKKHLALDDLKESIAELRFYLDYIPLDCHKLGK